MRAAVILTTWTVVGCGATARDTSGAVYTPPATSSGRRAESQTSSGSSEVNSSRRGVIPAGQEVDARLESTLSSESARPEPRFEATTAVDLTQDGEDVELPAAR